MNMLKKMRSVYLFLIVCLSMFIAACSTGDQSSKGTKKISSDRQTNEVWKRVVSEVPTDQNIEKEVKKLLSNMTLQQKVAQMIQPEIRDITVEDMRRYGFGSYLNGGGAFPNNNKHSTPNDWIELAEKMYQASIDDSLDGSKIPTMWGTDAVHGHNNVIGATLFPHNIGLGAMNNPALVEEIAKITATEVMVTGIDWVFAPTVATVRDDRWGRTYEGYSEDPEIVKIYAASVVKGLQGRANEDFLGDDRVISTVKHFLGDGGTLNGDDQGDNLSSEKDLYEIHAQGYVSGLSAGAQSVMASFNSWNGKKIHGYKYLLSDVLKNKMGFDGFVVGDWNGHGQIKDCENYNCPQAINAGLDVFMVPTDAWKPLMENTIQQVKDGVIAIERIDDAVTRILRVKMRAGLFSKPSPAKRKFSGKTQLIGSEEHRKVARQAVRESLVLLKNKQQTLPILPTKKILITGDGADNIGKQSGGWSITWQGMDNQNSDFPGGTSIYQGIKHQVERAGGNLELSADGSFSKKPDIAIVVFGEDPYAEGHGDLDNLDFQRGDKHSLRLIKRLKEQNIPVVSLFISGRPLWVNAELNASDAFVAVWLPGTEGEGVADVILSDTRGNIQHDFTGKLSFSWPKSANQTKNNRGDKNYQPLLPYGFGLAYGDENLLSDNLDESLPNSETESTVNNIYKGGIRKPWKMWLFSGEERVLVNSNAKNLEALHYRTIDKDIQEDAFNLILKGTKRAGIRIASHGNFREDLRASLESKSALEFSIKQLNKPSDEVYISMHCFAEQECGYSQNITKFLRQMPNNEWQRVSVNLNCFKNGGMKFGYATVPFELFSAGSLNISLADIALAPARSNNLSLTCD